GQIGRGVPFFDPSAFRPVQGTPERFGTAGRNSLRGPGYGNVDISLFRAFRATERLEIQFRAEAMNLTNTPHFNNPNANASDGYNPDGTLRTSSNFFAVTSARSDERQLRFGLRLSF
ncbi:MAG: hypothetical protein DMG08_05800, partial [Acidobacteria bacterium]